MIRLVLGIARMVQYGHLDQYCIFTYMVLYYKIKLALTPSLLSPTPSPPSFLTSPMQVKSYQEKMRRQEDVIEQLNEDLSQKTNTTVMQYELKDLEEMCLQEKALREELEMRIMDAEVGNDGFADLQERVSLSLYPLSQPLTPPSLSQPLTHPSLSLLPTLSASYSSLPLSAPYSLPPSAFYPLSQPLTPPSLSQPLTPSLPLSASYPLPPALSPLLPPSLSLLPTLSAPYSLPPSLSLLPTLSVPYSLPPSAFYPLFQPLTPPSLSQPLTPSLPLSAFYPLSQSLTPSLPQPFTHSFSPLLPLPLSATYSLPPSLSHLLPPSLSPPPPSAPPPPPPSLRQPMRCFTWRARLWHTGWSHWRKSVRREADRPTPGMMVCRYVCQANTWYDGLQVRMSGQHLV